MRYSYRDLQRLADLISNIDQRHQWFVRQTSDPHKPGKLYWLIDIMEKQPKPETSMMPIREMYRYLQGWYAGLQRRIQDDRQPK